MSTMSELTIEALDRKVDGLIKQSGGVAQAIRELRNTVGAVSSPHPQATSLTGRQKFRRHAVCRLFSKGQGTIGAAYALRYEKRALVNPATSVTPGWAQELVVADVADFLLGGSNPTLLARLRELGVPVDLAPIRIPFRTAGEVTGGWVVESGAIPIEAPSISSVLLVPKKAAAISVFSEETLRGSNRQVEALAETAMRSDLNAIVDTALVDDQPESPARPRGLRNGVAGLTPSAEADPLVAMRADLQALAAAVIAGGGNSVVYLVNPVQAVGVGVTAAPAMLSSSAVPAGMVIALDPAAFAAGLGAPAVELSQHATLHMNDVPATDLQGAPNVRSLWQSDSQGLRCILPCSWGVAPTRVAWMEAVAW